MKEELLLLNRQLHILAILTDAELLQIAELAYSFSSRATAEYLVRGNAIEFFPMNVKAEQTKQ